MYFPRINFLSGTVFHIFFLFPFLEIYLVLCGLITNSSPQFSSQVCKSPPNAFKHIRYCIDFIFLKENFPKSALLPSGPNGCRGMISDSLYTIILGIPSNSLRCWIHYFFGSSLPFFFFFLIPSQDWSISSSNNLDKGVDKIDALRSCTFENVFI